MHWSPPSAKFLLLGALLDNVNAHVPATSERSYTLKQVRTQAMPTATTGPLGVHDLRKRQASASTSTTYTITIAPDETCGYLSGSAGVGITCTNGAACTWVAEPAVGIFCGDEAYNNCIPMSSAVDPDLCDDVCQSNVYNLLCTETDAPFCRTYLFPSDLTDFRCASTSVSRPQQVDFTFDGQDNPNFATSTLFDEPETTIADFTETSTPVSHSTVSTTSSEPATSSSHDPGPNGGGSHKYIGAIVGGVVGGVALIALVALAVLFLRRRNRKRQTPPVNQTPAPVNQQPEVMTPEAKYNSTVPPTQSNWQQPPLSPPISSVSPISQATWDGQQHQHFAPAYEVAGPEARERDPIYEVDGDTPQETTGRQEKYFLPN